jgi:AcrR family transcriptional regulator
LSYNTTNYSYFAIRIIADRKEHMAERKTTQISSRKKPKQARSTDLVASILAAAVQVLEQEGAARFTTARVAEKAGVSIGSLYQYFPNKASILFQLQNDEWRQTATMLEDILADEQKTPLERLRILVHTFIRSECEEAGMRVALNDAAPLYRYAPEAGEGRASMRAAVQNFMRETLPKTSEENRMLAGDVIMTTLYSGGKTFSERSGNVSNIETFAAAMADMFCAYLKNLGHVEKSRARSPKREE